MRIAFLNPQGNFDKNDLYWTEHPDFGGQLVYVKEVAIAMAKQGHKVDIITRQIIDDEWPGFEEKFDEYEGVDGVRIVRLPFGGEKFLNKEKLWSYIYKYVDEIIKFYEEENTWPDFFTTHYGDGGIAGAILYEKTGIPFTFTGHSLGAQKMDKLNVSTENIEKLNKKYNFSLRLMAERISMANSAVNIVSTSQERYEQYSHKGYKGAVDVNNDSKFAIIPPGVNTELFNKEKENDQEEVVREKINKVFKRDLDENRQELPAIIAASRLDPKKNHIGLVKAYAKCKELQKKCNLVITLRGIDNPFEDYSMAKSEEKTILDEIMEIIDGYNLKGKVSMFSLNSQKQLAACYREFAKRKSVFSLTALYEPFGLAPIEAMACGLPAVVTKNGGPSEVLSENGEEFGVLVDPNNPKDIAKGLLKVLKNEQTYKKYQQKGLERVFSKYTWNSTAKGYIEVIKRKLNEMKKGKKFNKLKIHPFFKEPLNNEPVSLDWLKETYLGGDS
ncbi:glycosyltransferase [Thermohalobacter berrensis]|uniref:sucrose-phosphate synthase n=1 Tax=Thermohalobacter berrensis TaxID=99594 RepID=A0A419T5R4_9FIRM|nr:glycosyltransferase [Thermohalobacter berrensis]RKD32738.1 sucrose-phosphate synthase [Thermohalobacter berrensis]